jgi:hypothetical protein
MARFNRCDDGRGPMDLSRATAAGTWPPLMTCAPATGHGEESRRTRAAEAAAREAERIPDREVLTRDLLVTGLVGRRHRHH